MSSGVLQNVGCDNRSHETKVSTFVVLPKPISVNHMFSNKKTGGRIRSQAYRNWLQEAGWKLKAQKPNPVRGPVLILIGVERENNAADIDNLSKGVVDLLVKFKVIDDDRNVIGFAMAWNPPGNGQARVHIMPAASLSFQFQLSDGGVHGGWFLNTPENEGQ